MYCLLLMSYIKMNSLTGQYILVWYVKIVYFFIYYVVCAKKNVQTGPKYTDVILEQPLLGILLRGMVKGFHLYYDSSRDIR